MTRKRWPKHIPILQTSDMINGAWWDVPDDGNPCGTRGCLAGWLGVTFEGEELPDHYGPQAREFIIGVLARLGVDEQDLRHNIELVTPHPSALGFAMFEAGEDVCGARLRYIVSDLFESGGTAACSYSDWRSLKMPRGRRPSFKRVCDAWNAEARARGYVVERNR